MATNRKLGGGKSSKTVDAEVVDDEETGGEVAETTSSAVVIPDPDNQAQGDFSSSDIVYPRLTLMHKTSKLVEDGRFDVLDVVLNGEVAVGDQAAFADITVLAYKKIFEEDVEFDSGERGRTFNTIEEVREAGLWIEWQDGQRPPAYEKLVAMVLVKLPEHASAGETDVELDFEVEFPNMCEVGDEDEVGMYATCLWEMKGSGYTNAAKPIITAGQTPKLRGKIQHAKWKLRTDKRVYGKNTVTIPVLKRVGAHSDEFIEWAAGVTG